MENWDFYLHQELTRALLHGVSENHVESLHFHFQLNERHHSNIVGVMLVEDLWKVETFNNIPPEYQWKPMENLDFNFSMAVTSQHL